MKITSSMLVGLLAYALFTFVVYTPIWFVYKHVAVIDLAWPELTYLHGYLLFLALHVLKARLAITAST